MDVKLILSTLAAEHPDVFAALKVVRSAGAAPHIQPALNAMCEFALVEFAARRNLQARAADLVFLQNDPPPYRGARSFHSTKPNATILVKRICEIAGIAHQRISEHDDG